MSDRDRNAAAARAGAAAGADPAARTGPGRLSFEEARRRAGGLPALPAETVDLGAALGRVLARDVTATTDLPPADLAAMDGWAVAGPAPWRIVSPGPEARSAPAPLGPGEAVVIVTGAPLPPGATAVVRAEAGREDAAGLRADDPREGAPGRHVRPRGEEARAGDRLLVAGSRLEPPALALAALAGADAVEVRARPRVAVLVTGDELVDRGVPATGRVRDALSAPLPPVIEALGGRVTGVRRVPDDAEMLRAAIEATVEGADLLVTTGGTALSRADHLPAVLAALGAEPIVDGVAVRPGGPTRLARLRSGAYLLALPGNPFAALGALLALGAPALGALAGVAPPEPLELEVPEGDPGHPRATTLRPARREGALATVTGFDGPAMLRGLADADVLLLVPPGGLAAGAHAHAIALPWRRGASAVSALRAGR